MDGIIYIIILALIISIVFATGLTTGMIVMLRHCRKERVLVDKQNRLNKIDKILLLLLIATMLFVGWMVFLYHYHQSIPEPLVYCFFLALFGELSICGIVKNLNEKNKSGNIEELE